MVGLSAKVRELPVLLGKQKSLVGILAEASPATLVKDAPVLVLLNAGIVHRVGPNRMYVLLARALAAAGYTSLRFDHSGIGDSPNRTEVLPPLESALADVREAIDWLATTRQTRTVILVGLCAGADHSVLYSIADARVVGLALFDPSIPRTNQYHRNELRRKVTALVNKAPVEALGSVANLVKRSVANLSRRVLRISTEADRSDNEPVEARLEDDAVRSMFERHYRHCVATGVKMLAVFTGGLPAYHNYREQIIEAFPSVAFGNCLTLEYVPQTDHSFTSEANRELLQQSMLRWLSATTFNTPPEGSQRLAGG